MKLFLSKDAQLKKFLKTLKIHNKDLGICFNDHLAVFHLEKLIHSAVEEARKDTLKWVLDEIRINEGRLEAGLCDYENVVPLKQI